MSKGIDWESRLTKLKYKTSNFLEYKLYGVRLIVSIIKWITKKTEGQKSKKILRGLYILYKLY